MSHVRLREPNQPLTARPSYESALVDAQHFDLTWMVTMHRREVLDNRHCGAYRENVSLA